MSVRNPERDLEPADVEDSVRRRGLPDVLRRQDAIGLELVDLVDLVRRHRASTPITSKSTVDFSSSVVIPHSRRSCSSISGLYDKRCATSSQVGGS